MRVQNDFGIGDISMDTGVNEESCRLGFMLAIKKCPICRYGDDVTNANF